MSRERRRFVAAQVVRDAHRPTTGGLDGFEPEVPIPRADQQGIPIRRNLTNAGS